jgi:dienelactone hydrolase
MFIGCSYERNSEKSAQPRMPQQAHAGVRGAFAGLEFEVIGLPPSRKVLMLKVRLVAAVMTAGAMVLPASDTSTQTIASGLQKPPIVSATDAPTGTETLPVTWVTVAVPNLGVMRAAVARPSGTGPFPAVLILHGTHGFARQYVEWANDLARGGFIAVAACWFSGGGGAGAYAVTPPIPCPEIPPLGSGDYPEAVRFVEVLTTATRALPGVRVDRLALVGHSRGAGAVLQYLLAGGNVQAAILHSSGYALRPDSRAGEFNVPIQILHGTTEPAGGGSPNNHVSLARDFETALRRHQKTVEASYYEGGDHNSFFVNPAQRDDEVKRMLAFLHRHVGR